MSNYLILLIGMLLSISTAAQQIVAAEYFIGDDPGPGNGIPISIGANANVQLNSSIPTNTFSNGFYSIAIRTKHSSGIWSNTSKRNFYVTSASAGGSLVFHEITAAEYFIDTDPGPGQGISIDINAAPQISIVGSALANQVPGFHKLCIRTLSTAGLWSSTSARHFVVEAPSPGSDLVYHEIIAAEYFMGDDPGAGYGTAIDLAAGTDVDIIGSLVADMDPGVYKLAIRTKSSAGLWSNTASRMFIVKPVGGVNTYYEITAAEYFIDTDPGEGLGTPLTVTPGTSVIAEGTVPTTGLATGVHTMGIRFKGNTGIWCAAELAEFIIADNVPLTYTVTLGSPSCADTEDGFITLNVTTDPTQFTYTWNGSEGIPALENIPAGEYLLHVDDLFGDTVLDTLLTLTGPDPIVIYSTVTDALCAGEATGHIDAAAFGGINPFVYDWNGADFEALAAGTYTLEVTDANGCTASQSFTVNEPPVLTLSLVSTTPATTNLNCDGSIEVNASGGTPDYTVVWNDSNSQTTLTPVNLCAGSYEATLTDANGCVTTIAVDLLPSVVEENVLSTIQLQAAPNPTTGWWTLQFELQQAAELTIEVTDATGRVVMHEDRVMVSSGRSNRSYDWSHMAKGHYLVQVFTATHAQNMQLMVVP